MPEYTLFQPTYIDRKTKQQRRSDSYHIRFRDHLGRRQTLAGTPRERETASLADKVVELVRNRKRSEPLDDRMQKWIDGQLPKVVERLIEIELIERRPESSMPLLMQLDGEFDADKKLVTPGFKQALEARGSAPKHAKDTTDRGRRIIKECGFVFWKDLIAPGAATLVEVFLGKLREDGEIAGPTVNYYMRDLKSFCRWLAKQKRAPSIAMAELTLVKNTETDAETRRPLSVVEMKHLMDAAAAAGINQGLSGPERSQLYRFAFETGMRPGQIRALQVKDFDLDVEPPTVTTHAMYVKRRRTHVQVLRPSLAAALKKEFAGKMPSASAVKMPSKYHMAEMLRNDLKLARDKWIDDAKKDDKEREKRQRSDFLAAENHKGEVAVFYSTRHGHGTALAQAGVPESAIAASMHHASKKTTQRYIHAGQESVVRAIGSMSDLEPTAMARTGTDDCLRNACAAETSSVDSGGQKQRKTIKSQTAENSGKSSVSGGNQPKGLLAELADAMDSKSIARKGVSVRLR